MIFYEVGERILKNYCEEKGKIGEDLVYEWVNDMLSSMDFEYRIARNTILPFESVYGEKRKITAEFDISVFTPYFVFLIEVKNEVYTKYDYGEPLWEIKEDMVSNPLVQNQGHKKVFCSEMNIPREKVLTIEILLENGKCKNQKSPYPNDYIFDKSDFYENAKFLFATESSDSLDYEALFTSFKKKVNAHKYTLEDHKSILNRTEKIETRIRRVLGWINLHRTDTVICPKCKTGYLFFGDKKYVAPGNSKATIHYFLKCSNYTNEDVKCVGLIYVDKDKSIDEFKAICPVSIEIKNDWGEEKVVHTLLDEVEEIKKERDSLHNNVLLLEKQKNDLERKLVRSKEETKQYVCSLQKQQHENETLHERLDSFRKILGNIYLYREK